jgi:hypothetical protein
MNYKKNESFIFKIKSKLCNSEICNCKFMWYIHFVDISLVLLMYINFINENATLFWTFIYEYITFSWLEQRAFA